MANIIISPSKYVQGQGELQHLSGYVKNMGKSMLILISDGGKKRIGPMVEKSFQDTGIAVTFEVFGGECSETEINRLRAVVAKNQCDCIVGIGGGKILDTAKAVAYYEKTPVVICPTIASTDAPCSAISVIYTDDGVFERYLFLPQNPNLVVVDSSIIAAAPARLLVSGMGDALATYFEARATKLSRSTTCAGGQVTSAAMALAKLCYDTLLSEGVKAKIAMEAGVCTEAVERIIEANTYLSGIGFESGGLAGAHAIHNGLTCIKECHHLYHGEKVAFGTLTQLVLENAPEEEIEEVVSFCIEVGLPVTFAQMGIKKADKAKLMEAATLACGEGDTLRNMPLEVTPEKVCAALIGADAIGRYFME